VYDAVLSGQGLPGRREGVLEPETPGAISPALG